MRVGESLNCATTLGLCLIAVGLTGCCNYPKPLAITPSGNAPALPSITIVAYGDTRTGPFGLGDNAKQAIHGMVVTDILTHDQQNKGEIDGVIFTGDAVMTNFFLWKKSYWRCFLSQADRFHTEGIPFYPSLGNHEVLPGFVPAFSLQKELTPVADTHDLEPRKIEATVATEYDRGEEPTPSPELFAPTTTPGQQVDISTKAGQEAVRQWERQISRGNLQAAYKFGQFEHNLQQAFYSEPVDQRCSSDVKTFHDDYLLLPQYKYLRPLLQDRSYYSVVISKSGIQVKLLALDTNCLDSQRQQQFFVDEVKDFAGPIIVFGHHPPVDYNSPVGWNWDKVPGWGMSDNDPLKSYFRSSTGSHIVLWVFGHVHDYQRRGPAGASVIAEAPVLLIAGGGGASLDQSAAAFQWQPASWPQSSSNAAYSQVKINITSAAVIVETRGAKNSSDSFQRLDSFTIPLTTAAP